jgi:hypothetical protein
MKKGTLSILAAVLLAACGAPEPGNDQPSPPAAPAPPPAAPETGSTAGMQGMSGMKTKGIMEELRTHLQAMHGAAGDSLRAMLPTHRQMAASLLAEMNREMRLMKDGRGARLDRHADSVRQDLVRLPEMGAAELQSAMPAHEARLNRLVGMHQAMIDAGH